MASRSVEWTRRFVRWGCGVKEGASLIVHLVDGTYELFRHFYGRRRGGRGDSRFGAVIGVLHAVLHMLEDGAAHLGVATDHVIESFRACAERLGDARLVERCHLAATR